MSETSKHKNQHSFKEGNTAAEKWYEENALEFIESVYQFNEDNKQNYTLAGALVDGNNAASLWAYLTNKFKENAPVLKAIKRVERQLEGRIVNDTLTATAKSAAMAIFLLKNKHGYEDRTQVDTSEIKAPQIDFSDSASDD
ncbi:MAG TPA: hypothetical protein EYN67_16320 [Flavobacteriales bacterium]|jgi:hypothetical protein|nr:hypothetical protein [Flavobacteriales bacterium]